MSAVSNVLIVGAGLTGLSSAIALRQAGIDMELIEFAVEGLMEGLALILATFGIAVSVLEPSPVRTAFLRNAGGLTRPAADDPYAALLGSYNATMTGVHAAGQAPMTSPTSSRRSRATPGPSCAISPRQRGGRDRLPQARRPHRRLNHRRHPGAPAPGHPPGARPSRRTGMTSPRRKSWRQPCSTDATRCRPLRDDAGLRSCPEGSWLRRCY